MVKHIGTVSSQIDIDLVKCAVAQDFIMGKLKEIICNGGPPYKAVFTLIIEL